MMVCVTVTYAYEIGSQNKNFEPGRYTLPVELMKASDIDSPSMAGSCIKGAVLEITDDEEPYVIVDIGSVTVGTIIGYAEEWKIYQSNDTAGEKVAAEYTTDNSGNVNQIKFKMPDNTFDGVYLNMYIDVMGSYQDAYLAMDFENAVLEGESVVKTYTGTGHVDQFGKYDVNVTVTVTDGIITAIEISGENFNGTYADYNETKLQQAAGGLKDSYIGLAENNAEDIYSVDAVSSATISSQAIRDAIMDALGLVIEEEIINVPSEKLSEGEYEVEIALYSDVVEHSLLENETAKANISVDEFGNMTLTTDVISGTSKEPLQILEFNGYYENNSTSDTLTSEGTKVTKEISSYSDEYMEQGTEIVTNI